MNMKSTDLNLTLPLKEGGLQTQNKFKFSTETKPLISIITIVFNRKDLLEITVQSVIGQSYENIEYIIVDGGSTDGTVEVIRQYEDKIDYWVSEPDEGIADAMNKGINLSSGILIAHLHAGDRFVSQDIVSQIVESYKNEKWRWCFGNQALVNSTGDIVSFYHPPKYSKRILHLANIIPHATVFAERSLFQEVGGFDKSFKCAMDYHLWLRFAQISEPKQFDLTIALFLLGGFSANIKLALQEEFRARVEVLKQSSVEKLISFCVICIRILKRWLNITTFVKFNGSNSKMTNF